MASGNKLKNMNRDALLGKIAQSPNLSQIADPEPTPVVVAEVAPVLDSPVALENEEVSTPISDSFEDAPEKKARRTRKSKSSTPVIAEEKEEEGDHKQTMVYITEDQRRKIAFAAINANMTRSALVRIALDEYFASHKHLLTF